MCHRQCTTKYNFFQSNFASLEFSQPSEKLRCGTIITPIQQMRKLRHRLLEIICKISYNHFGMKPQPEFQDFPSIIYSYFEL